MGLPSKLPGRSEGEIDQPIDLRENEGPWTLGDYKFLLQMLLPKDDKDRITKRFPDRIKVGHFEILIVDKWALTGIERSFSQASYKGLAARTLPFLLLFFFLGRMHVVFPSFCLIWYSNPNR